jgi:adenosyl cobinamide kinase/adenosyl cobinamide phosphate guanylyltransferase
MNKTLRPAACLLLVAACAAPEAYAPTARGHLAVSANDNKAVLVNGVTTAVPNHLLARRPQGRGERDERQQQAQQLALLQGKRPRGAV